MPEAKLERRVTETDTAAALDPALPAAASTPFVLALAEGACHQVLVPRLRDGEISVGARADIAHLSPSAVGATLVASATLVDDGDGRFTFDVEVLDAGRVVARVRHVRAIVPQAMIDRQLAAGG